jgi:hypothetical protein
MSKELLAANLVCIARPGVPGAEHFANAIEQGRLTVVSRDGQSLNPAYAAAIFANWLEKQFDATVEPFGFMAEIAICEADRPTTEVADLAFAMLGARGWAVSPNGEAEPLSSVTLMHPDSVGF